MTLGPLQQHAQDLLLALKRKATRGNVIAAIQASVDEVLVEISKEMCPSCQFSGTKRGVDHPPVHGEAEGDACAAARMWQAWERARPRLWGNLA